MNRHAPPGPAMGCPYDAVGMQRALESAIGLPSRSTSASRMLAFLMPADVTRNRIQPPGVITADENFLGIHDRMVRWRGSGLAAAGSERREFDALASCRSAVRRALDHAWRWRVREPLVSGGAPVAAKGCRRAVRR